MQNIVLQYTSDPGHGWLHVKRTLAKRILGEDFSRISPFSYQRGQTLYLEEDQDAYLFIRAAERQGFCIDMNMKHVERTPIRSYQSFSP